MKISGIAVFLGSSDGKSPFFKQLAYNFGNALATRGIKVIYGGADVGTMAALADGVISADGDITGVFPTGFEGSREITAMNVEIERKNTTRCIRVRDFAERKRVMEEMSDCAVVLPGSIGTMDEMFCYGVNNEIGLHDKPVFVLNANGYYDGLEMQVRTMVANGFLSGNCNIIRFVKSQEELFRALEI